MCRICELIKNPDSKIYYEDKDIMIINNISKFFYEERRMIMYKKHKKRLNNNELGKFMNKVLRIKSKLKGKWDVEICLRTIPNHFHVHLGRTNE